MVAGDEIAQRWEHSPSDASIDDVHQWVQETDPLVRRQYIGDLIGHFSTQLETMTRAEQAHSAGILANTFLTHNMTHDNDTYAVSLEALSADEQETVRILFQAAKWGEVFYGSTMRRISLNLSREFASKSVKIN